jgi:uncharacterized protein (DUF934 family)
MIHDRQVRPARFALLLALPEGFTPVKDTAIPLADWLGLASSGEAGDAVVVRGDEDIAPLEAHVSSLALVAFPLPKFSDGRIYSHIYRLRHLWGFRGDILVAGDVLRDQLLHLARVGANAFHMRPDQDLHASLSVFSLFTEHYQTV